MAGGTQLGGTFSLLGGFDATPVKLRQDQQRINLALQESLAGQKAQDRGMTLAERKQTHEEKLFEREFAFKANEVKAQRAHEEYLTRLQQSGRVDLAELTSAADTARQAADIRERQRAQADSQEFQQKQFAEKLALDSSQFEARMIADRMESDSKFMLDISRGNREDARLSIDKQMAELQTLKTQRELNNLPTPEEAKAQRAMDTRMAQLQLRKAAMELEDMGTAAPVLQVIREAEARLKQQQADGLDPSSRVADAQIESIKAGTENTKMQTKKGDLELERAGKAFEEMDAKKAAEGAGKAEEGFLDPEMAKSGKVPPKAKTFLTREEHDARELAKQKEEGKSFFSKMVGTGLTQKTGTGISIEAYNQIENLGDNQSEEAADMRKGLRRIAVLSAKAGGEAFGFNRGFFVNPIGTAAGAVRAAENALTTTLSSDEAKELNNLIATFEEKYHIELIGD